MTVMKKEMFLATFISLAGMLAAGAVYCLAGNRMAYSAAITFGTVFYHLGVRLAAGHLIDAKYHNQMDYTKKWFCERRFERKLYEKIRVQKWKTRMPTFQPQSFQLKRSSLGQVVQATCQAEIVHEVNIVLSFVPVLFSIWFGSRGVFLLTSCLAALFDGAFVIIQRYNRPRLMQLLNRQRN